MCSSSLGMWKSFWYYGTLTLTNNFLITSYNNTTVVVMCIFYSMHLLYKFLCPYLKKYKKCICPLQIKTKLNYFESLHLKTSRTSDKSTLNNLSNEYQKCIGAQIKKMWPTDSMRLWIKNNILFRQHHFKNLSAFFWNNEIKKKTSETSHFHILVSEHFFLY